MAFALGQGLIDLTLGSDRLKAAVGDVAGIFDNLKYTVAGIGASLVGAMSLRSVIEEASQAELNEVRLSAALVATGAASQYSATQLQEYAKQLASSSIFTDDAVMQAEALLLKFRNLRGIMPDVIRLAMDMSAATGMDLSSAASYMGRALNNPVMGLSLLYRQGVVFTAQERKMVSELVKGGRVAEAQAAIMLKLRDMYRGTADAVGNTLYGQSRRTKNEMGELAEDIGKTFLPELSHVVSAVRPVVASFREWVSTNSGVVKGVVGLIGAIGGLMLIAPTLNATIALSKTLVVAAMTPVGWLSLIVIGLGVAFVYATGKGDTFSEKLADVIKQLREGRSVVSGFASDMKEGFESAFDLRSWKVWATGIAAELADLLSASGPLGMLVDTALWLADFVKWGPSGAPAGLKEKMPEWKKLGDRLREYAAGVEQEMVDEANDAVLKRREAARARNATGRGRGGSALGGLGVPGAASPQFMSALEAFRSLQTSVYGQQNPPWADRMIDIQQQQLDLMRGQEPVDNEALDGIIGAIQNAPSRLG